MNSLRKKVARFMDGTNQDQPINSCFGKVLCLKVRGRSASYLLYGCAQLRFFRFQDSSRGKPFHLPCHPKRPRRPAALCKCSSMVVNNFSPVRPLWKRVSSTVRHRIIRVRVTNLQIFWLRPPGELPWCATLIIVQQDVTVTGLWGR